MTNKLRVVKESAKSSSTDIDLLVESYSAEEVGPWNKERVVESLILEADLEKEKAEDVARVVEERIMQLKLTRISTSLVRELINHELLERGENRRLKRYQDVGLPISDIEAFTFSKSLSNSNINNNNPESVAFFLSENITKKWALRNIFSQDVTRAHLDGRIYIHDLGMVERLYCFGGNIPEYLKKYGLQDLDSLSTKSFPASTANTLVGHINTFLSIIQAYFAGALGLGFLNIFFAPYLRNMSREQVYNLAQHFIFSLSQNCFSRGAQVLFIDLNLHFGIPEVLKNVPAIGPRGKYMIEMQIKDTCNNSWIFYSDKPEIDLEKIDVEIKALNVEAERLYKEEGKGLGDVCYGFPESVKADNIEFRVMAYGDFEKEAQMFLDVILQLYKEGDKQGNFFYFPKIDLHITKECFEDEKQKALLLQACETASVNGTPYFIYDRDSTVLSQCCRLKAEINDEELIKHPESIRFTALQNVTINLPQAAYRAGKGNFSEFIEEVYKGMDLAMRAHEQKARLMKKCMKPGAPLYTVGKNWKDGIPWVDLDKTTRIIGLLGLNEAMQFLFDKGLDDEKSYKKGLETITKMYHKCEKLEKEFEYPVRLEETPAESLAYRAAKVDLQSFPEQAKSVVKGSVEEGGVYYSNSIHLAVDSPAGVIDRIKKQSSFHPLVKSGSMIHLWVGENLPDPGSLFSLLQKVYENTACDQICVSPNFTICNDCNNRTSGLLEECVQCKSKSVYHVTRVTGYFSRIENYNAGKKQEVKDRQKGDYKVVTEPAPVNLCDAGLLKEEKC